MSACVNWPSARLVYAVGDGFAGALRARQGLPVIAVDQYLPGARLQRPGGDFRVAGLAGQLRRRGQVRGRGGAVTEIDRAGRGEQ